MNKSNIISFETCRLTKQNLEEISNHIFFIISIHRLKHLTPEKLQRRRLVF